MLVMLTTESPMGKFDAYRTWNGESSRTLVSLIRVGVTKMPSSNWLIEFPVKVNRVFVNVPVPLL